ncbi:uncharacterized protein METZ01_LOCUS207873, partial [marine metagenome]
RKKLVSNLEKYFFNLTKKGNKELSS